MEPFGFYFLYFCRHLIYCKNKIKIEKKTMFEQHFSLLNGSNTVRLNLERIFTHTTIPFVSTLFFFLSFCAILKCISRNINTEFVALVLATCIPKFRSII